MVFRSCLLMFEEKGKALRSGRAPNEENGEGSERAIWKALENLTGSSWAGSRGRTLTAFSGVALSMGLELGFCRLIEI